MKSLIVPLDGSAIAEQVLPHVKRLATLLVAQVHLLQVVSDEEIAGVLACDGQVLRELGDRSPTDADAQRVGELLRQRAADYLAARAAELCEAGVPAEIVVREGSPAEQIVSLAEGDSQALIAMATHGYTGLRRWALGSVADKVLHIANNPVFLVRATTQPPSDVRPWKRILVPLDGSALAEQALPPAIELACAARAELVLLQVVVPLIEYVPGLSPFNRPLAPSIKYPEFVREQAQQQLSTTIERFGMPGVAMTAVAIFGYPAETIVDEASARPPDLIVMATHGYSGLRRWALGSVADKVLHASSVPLLLVRSREDAPPPTG